MDSELYSIFDERYPARRVLALIGDKWSPIVLYCLSGSMRRFGELQRSIPDISKKMLVQVLRTLEADGLVDRKVHSVVPPHIEYSLTPLGRKVHEPIGILCAWALDHQDVLDAVAIRRRAQVGKDKSASSLLRGKKLRR